MSELVEQTDSPMSETLAAPAVADESTAVEPILPAPQQPVLPEAIVEDHLYVTDCLPPAAILTLTKEYVTVIIMRTAYARVQLRVQYPENYPAEVPIVELASPTLPQPLLRNKEKECMDKARETSLGKAQFAVIYELIYNFIHTNLFIPCWKEIKQVMTLVNGGEGKVDPSKAKGQIGADEKEGVVQLRLSCGAYRQNIKLKVPYNYPEEGVEIEFLTSNLPQDIQYMFKAQAEDIVRKCEAGIPPEQALQQGGNPVKQISAKLQAANSSNREVKMTASNIQSLKHDVNVLKQMSDLRAATQVTNKKAYFTQVNAERREARKDLRKLAKAESAAEQEAHRKMMEEEQNMMKELLKMKVSDTAQNSLFVVAKFLIEDYACRMPVESCQACRKTVLPADPKNEAALNPKSDSRPMRTFCGHWLHWNCLNEWLTTPPFVRNCPVCTNRRIWHPDWPEDYKQLEKAWQTREARKREMSDVSFISFLNFCICMNECNSSLE
jgi:hypothetical protein